MPEQQNLEYKQSWHDDYLKWVCGFANAQGGVIFIGKDDNGNVVNVVDFKKLMDDIPNKVRNSMGITVEVNLHEEKGNHFIEIITLPYSVPISLRRRYYYRSGSIKQELTGAALNEYLLKKAGRTWDDVIEEDASLSDIDEQSVNECIKDGNESGRMPDVKGLSTLEVLDKLRVVKDGKLKRAAIILFGKDPNRFYPNVQVKIGRFTGKDEDLKFQEVEEGNLVQLLENVPKQLNRTFLTKQIDFKGFQRIETGEYPVAAIREMLLNALVHKTYMGSTIQFRVYDNKITIWNEGNLPEGLDYESLKRTHSSLPRNPIIADVCFKTGYIDTWGRGTLKIFNSCREAELPEPEIHPMDGGVLVTLYKDYLNSEQLKKMGLNDRQINAIVFVKKYSRITNKEYQELNHTSERTATRDLYGLIENNILKNSKVKGAGSFYFLV